MAASKVFLYQTFSLIGFRNLNNLVLVINFSQNCNSNAGNIDVFKISNKNSRNSSTLTTKTLTTKTLTTKTLTTKTLTTKTSQKGD